MITKSAITRFVCWSIVLAVFFSPINAMAQGKFRMPLSENSNPKQVWLSEETRTVQDWIVAGGTHSCALTPEGGVVCWGSNFAGQLGDGNSGVEQDPMPELVPTLRSGIRSLSLAWGRTCALSEFGKVFCWGNNTGTIIPQVVEGLGNQVTQLAVGEHHYCALTITGEVLCWGLNNYGQLGNGTETDSLIPVTAVPSGAAQVAVYGYTSCAVMDNGQVLCWGSGGRGQLGNGLIPTDPDYHSNLPNPVKTQNGDYLAGAKQVGLGITYGCALTNSQVQCWGTNRFGQLGNGAISWSATPYAMPVKDETGTGVLNDVDQLSVGAESACVHLANKEIRCWGQNFFGQIGNGQFLPDANEGGVVLPAPVLNSDGTQPLQNTQTVSVGDNHACTFLDWEMASPYYCWGQGDFGQLGNGLTTSSNLPSAVTNFFSLPIGGFVPNAQIVAGHAHTCSLSVGEGLKCWGENANGQLGDGTTTNSQAPVDVIGLSSGVYDLSMGKNFSCTIVDWGRVKCWGENTYGQLGDGSMQDSSVPKAAVLGDVTILKLSAGDNHVCALTLNGSALCWGDNRKGQLGDGTTTTRTDPVMVLPGGVTDIAAGGESSCAVLESGGVQCWGGGDMGQLGDGSSGSGYYQAAPQDVLGEGGLLTGIIRADLGLNFGCALSSEGTVWCWGANASGQLGRGSETPFSARAGQVISYFGGDALTGVKQISAGGSHACARLYTNRLKCWGLGESGQLGDGTLGAGTRSFLPHTVLDHYEPFAEDIPYLEGVIQVSAGAAHTCAFLNWSDPLPYRCWGENENGQLGDGEWSDPLENTLEGTTDQPYPNPVQTILAFRDPPIRKIVSGFSHSCAITQAGAVKCWGLNLYGELGNDTYEVSDVPVEISELHEEVKTLSAGTNFSCALTQSGVVKCWGVNNVGQLGNGTNSNSFLPVDVVGLSGGVVDIASGSAHTCALLSNGGVKCWGDNGNYQLGDDTYEPSKVPVDVIGLSSGIIGLSLGGGHSCALTSTGGVVCWGSNQFGELGNGSDVYWVGHPVDVTGLGSGVIGLAAGAKSQCALLTSGIKCWGSNEKGQLGINNPSVVQSKTPLDVVGLDIDAVKISSGHYHVCAILADRTVRCWGNNNKGQIGDNTKETRFQPVAISGNLANINAISAGEEFTCATSSGRTALRCWGNNYYGQFGNGTRQSSLVPVDSMWLTTDGLLEDNKAEVILPLIPGTSITFPGESLEEPVHVEVRVQILADLVDVRRYRTLSDEALLLELMYDVKPPWNYYYTYLYDDPIETELELLTNNTVLSDEERMNLYKLVGTEWIPMMPCTGCFLDTENNMLISSMDGPGLYAVLIPKPALLYLPIILH